MKSNWKITRAFLRMKYMENGKVLWYCAEVVLVVIAFLIKTEKTMGLALITGGMLLSAYFVAAFHSHNGVDMLLSGDGRYRKRKAPLIVLAALAENIPMCMAALLYICVAGGRLNALCIVYAFCLYLFITAVGLFAGVLFKKQNTGFMVCALLAAVNFQRTLFLEENLRYISPVIQLANMNTFQWWNLSVLLVIAAAAYLVILAGGHRMQIKCVTAAFLFMAAGSIIAIDVCFSERSAVLPADYKAYAENVLEKVNKKNGVHGFQSYGNVKAYQSIYYPWEPNREKRVIYAQDDTLYMNCFTESLCCVPEEEIIIRCVRSLLKPGSKAQRAMEELYVNLLLGNINYVEGFLYDNQRKAYGEIASKDYGFYAEILLKTPDKFAQLYELGKECQTSTEIMEAWNDKAD